MRIGTKQSTNHISGPLEMSEQTYVILYQEKKKKTSKNIVFTLPRSPQEVLSLKTVNDYGKR